MRGIIAGTLIVLVACGDNGSSDAPEVTGASITTDEDVPITAWQSRVSCQ